jgi:cytidylate kinase
LIIRMVVVREEQKVVVILSAPQAKVRRVAERESLESHQAHQLSVAERVSGTGRFG